MSNPNLSMNVDPLLLAPGPVQLHPEVQKILSEPMIHHRTPEFDQILSETLKGLKFLFQTENPVFMHTSTGSGGMESALVNLLSPGDDVLAIVSGKFGERWADMAEVYGARVHRMNIEWGHAVDPNQVQDFLKNNPNVKLVLTQACETSTATAHDVQTLGKIVSKTNALLVVDGITAVAAYPIPMDQWNIDVLVAGSQKGVMLPTGLSFISFSKKAMAIVEQAKTPRYYFDVRRELKANKNGETLFSSNVPLVKALRFVLNDIQAQGLENHFKTISRRARFTRAMALNMGLNLFSKSPSDSVTAINLPADVKGVEFRTALEKTLNITVMGGQDQLKGKIIRLGHMGYILDSHLVETMVRLSRGLSEFGFKVDAEKTKVASEAWLRANPL